MFQFAERLKDDKRQFVVATNVMREFVVEGLWTMKKCEKSPRKLIRLVTRVLEQIRPPTKIPLKGL